MQGKPTKPSAHASQHAAGGADPIDGDALEVSRAATNYTPSGSTLAGHLAGVDAALAGGGGGGSVDSVFGRTGVVAAAASDYDANQVDFAPNGDIAATDVQAAIVEVRDDADTKLAAKADSSALTAHTSSTANPHGTDVGNLGSGTLAELNAAITDATLDDASATRTPSAHATAHEAGGGDEITGASLELTRTATNYTSAGNTLGQHIAGIDTALGSVGGGGGDSTTEALRDLSSSNYYEGAAGDLPGATGGFTVAATIRLAALPTHEQIFFSCMHLFSYAGVQGGWGLGIDGVRWKFYTSRQSDGFTTGLSFAAELPELDLIGPLYTLAMVFDGVDTSTCYVNGRVVGSLGNTGGYEVANASLSPFVGWTNNSANTGSAADEVDFLGGGYVETSLTAAQVAAHHLACFEADAFADEPSAGWASWYSLEGETSAPATLTDQGAGGANLTRTGMPSIVEIKRRHAV